MSTNIWGLRARHLAAAVACAWLCQPGLLRAEDNDDKPVPTAAQPPAPAKDVHREPGVNINTASLNELQMLPGIGERKAEGIISRREKKKFTRPEEIMEVKGIGRGIYKRCKAFVRIAGPTTLAQKVNVSGSAKKG